MLKPLLKSAVCAGTFASLALLSAGYSSGPPPRHTGGFGEKTCLACHSDHSLNEGRLLGGTFAITGTPRQYQPGAHYSITVAIGQPYQSRWGFQLTSRFAVNGRQAGELIPQDSMTQVREEAGVQYIEHNRSGGRASAQDGPAEVVFTWATPVSPQGPVIFNAAGNAANSDADTTGDFVYTAGAYSQPPFVLTGEPAPAAGGNQPPQRLSSSSRFIHIPAPADLARGSTEVHIEHRFLQSLGEATPGTAFGVDFGANILLGFNHALSDRLSVGASRARFDQVITFTGTYELAGGRNSPLQLSVLGGIEGLENFRRQYSPFLQAAVSCDLGRLRLLAAPTLVLNSRDERALEFRPDPVSPSANYTFALGMGIDWVLTPRLSLASEAVPRLSGFGGYGSRNPAYSAGIKIHSRGHVFSIIASTSRAFTPGQYAVNNGKDFSLGFNIYRRIR